MNSSYLQLYIEFCQKDEEFTVVVSAFKKMKKNNEDICVQMRF